MIEQILAQMFGSMFGSGASAPGPASGTGSGIAPQSAGFSPSMVQKQPSPQAGGGFLNKAGQILGDQALSAIGSRMTAGLQGQATLAYNEAAFPGTNPWEHLGGGAKGQELAQLAATEKQSRRQQETALRQTQMAGASQFASSIMNNLGAQGYGIAEQVLNQAGVMRLPGGEERPWAGMKGAVSSGMRANDARAHLDSVSAALADFRAETERLGVTTGAIPRNIEGLARQLADFAGLPDNRRTIPDIVNGVLDRINKIKNSFGTQNNTGNYSGGTKEPEPLTLDIWK